MAFVQGQTAPGEKMSRAAAAVFMWWRQTMKTVKSILTEEG